MKLNWWYLQRRRRILLARILLASRRFLGCEAEAVKCSEGLFLGTHHSSFVADLCTPYFTCWHILWIHLFFWIMDFVKVDFLPEFGRKKELMSPSSRFQSKLPLDICKYAHPVGQRQQNRPHWMNRYCLHICLVKWLGQK